MMIAINVTLSLIMLAVSLLLFVIFAITAPTTDWGDITQAVLFVYVSNCLFKYLLYLT